MFEKETIAKVLRSVEIGFPEEIHRNGYKVACVLLPLVYEQGQWCILFTKRTETLFHHKGQISFPGGMAEAEDDAPLETALRETEEELGIQRSTVQILGRMDDFYTISNMHIYPFVGILKWPQELNLSIDEVSKIIIIPVKWLIDPEHSTEKEYNGHSDVVFYQEFEGDTLWGITARMTKNFLQLLKERK